MDGFGDDNFGDVDPAAEFLAREQQDLAGLDDDLKPVTSAPISLGMLFKPVSRCLKCPNLQL